MFTHDIPIQNVKAYENNPRKNDDAVDAVAESIKQFGFLVPLVVDDDGNIIAGHTRYKASVKLGLESVPCVVAHDLSEEQIRKFRLIDNKTHELSHWDYPMLAAELEGLVFEDFDLDWNLPAMEGTLDDFFSEGAAELPDKTKHGVKAFTDTSEEATALFERLKADGLKVELI